MTMECYLGPLSLSLTSKTREYKISVVKLSVCLVAICLFVTCVYLNRLLVLPISLVVS